MWAGWRSTITNTPEPRASPRRGPRSPSAAHGTRIPPNGHADLVPPGLPRLHDARTGVRPGSGGTEQGCRRRLDPECPASASGENPLVEAREGVRRPGDFDVETAVGARYRGLREAMLVSPRRKMFEHRLRRMVSRLWQHSPVRDAGMRLPGSHSLRLHQHAGAGGDERAAEADVVEQAQPG